MKKTTVLTAISVMSLFMMACGKEAASTETTTKSDKIVSSEANETNTTETELPSENKNVMSESSEINKIWADGTTVYFDVPAKAGGGTDLQTRYLTAALSEEFPGVNFIVNNYEVSEVGNQHLAKAKPDGLTLTLVSCTNMDNYLSGASSVNPTTDMTVIAKIHAGGANAWICAPDAPYNNIKELADYINENPGDLTIGCSLGGTSQLIWLNTLNDIDENLKDKVNFVQCSSEADKLTNIASGAIDLSNCSVNNAQNYLADNKLKVLGTIGPEAATLEAVSQLVGNELDSSFMSTKEQGIDSIWDSGYYVSGPAGMDEATVKAISDTIMDLEDSKTFLDGMATMGQIVDLKPTEDARKDFDMEWDINYTLISDLGLLVR